MIGPFGWVWIVICKARFEIVIRVPRQKDGGARDVQPEWAGDALRPLLFLLHPQGWLRNYLVGAFWSHPVSTNVIGKQEKTSSTTFSGSTKTAPVMIAVPRSAPQNQAAKTSSALIRKGSSSQFPAPSVVQYNISLIASSPFVSISKSVQTYPISRSFETSAPGKSYAIIRTWLPEAP